MVDGTTTNYYVVCGECEAHFECSPTNYVSVRDFEYCPQCGAQLPEDNPRQIEHSYGWMPPQDND